MDNRVILVFLKGKLLSSRQIVRLETRTSIQGRETFSVVVIECITRVRFT